MQFLFEMKFKMFYVPFGSYHAICIITAVANVPSLTENVKVCTQNLCGTFSEWVEVLTHFWPMFHLRINQVVSFY